MTRLLAVAGALCVLAPMANSWADDAPAPPPPQHTWVGKGQLGFLEAKGNTNAESVNGGIDVSRYDDNWKNSAGGSILYGKNTGVVSAERWELHEQTEYTISKKTFAFGGLRFEHDMFDGFVYQGSITAGLGYHFLDSVSDKLTAQVGVGFRKLRPETLTPYIKDGSTALFREYGDAENEVIGTVSVDYLHKFSATTTLTNSLLVESGSSNTLATDKVALAVKMTDRLALSVGYMVKENTNPPAPLKKVDTETTINLVFAF